MNFNVFSLLNVTSLLSDYLSQLQLFSGRSVVPSSPLSPSQEQQVPSASATAATDDGTETLLDADQQQFDLNILADVVCFVRNVVGQWIGSVGSPLEFTDFQAHIGKTFLVILCVNLLLIGFYWRKYGSIITDRFIRPSTAKEIEELKLSVARLKLPKEHSPRI